MNRFDGNLVTLQNAAAATISGIEADVVAAPTSDLKVTLGLAYLNAEYDRFVTDDPDQPLLGPIDLAGNKLVRSPELSVNAAIEYTRQIGNVGALTGRLAYQYRSKYFFTPYNAPGVAESGYGLINATLDYSQENGPWHAGLFVRNLDDTLYYQNMLRSAGLVGTVGFVGAPRTYGIQIGYDF